VISTLERNGSYEIGMEFTFSLQIPCLSPRSWCDLHPELILYRRSRREVPKSFFYAKSVRRTPQSQQTLPQVRIRDHVQPLSISDIPLLAPHIREHPEPDLLPPVLQCEFHHPSPTAPGSPRTSPTTKSLTPRHPNPSPPSQKPLKNWRQRTLKEPFDLYSPAWPVTTFTPTFDVETKYLKSNIDSSFMQYLLGLLSVNELVDIGFEKCGFDVKVGASEACHRRI
jgi:hypothetical protein